MNPLDDKSPEEKNENLKDVLSEMDSFEKEFDTLRSVKTPSDETPSPTHETLSNPDKSPLKDNIVPMDPQKDPENNPSYQPRLDQLEKDLDHLEQKKMTSKEPSSRHHEEKSESNHPQKQFGIMKFSGMGRMNRFEMNFTLGKKNIEFVMADTLKITMPGLELIIDEDNGCQINPSAGTRLMIPIN